MSEAHLLEVAQGRFVVSRPASDASASLRAWDAADEYALAHLHEVGASGDGWVIVNDTFGALTVALAPHLPAMVSDSVLAHRAAAANLAANGVDPEVAELVPATTAPRRRIDVLVVKVPRTLSLLEHQLHTLRRHLHPGTVVVGAGMTKHVHMATLALFERLVGPTHSSLARKKARLILATVDPACSPGPSPYPGSFRIPSGHDVVGHAGVFSRARLDHGTALLLDHLPRDLGSSQVVDLGCGSGVVGLTVAVTNPEANLTFTDESYLAVASAEATMDAAFPHGSDARFLVGDGLEEVADESVDLVVVNPPFHDDRARTYETAWQMFREAKRGLRPGGRIMVVGNRHLGYHAKLRRCFGGSDVVASTPKFVVLSATR